MPEARAASIGRTCHCRPGVSPRRLMIKWCTVARRVNAIVLPGGDGDFAFSQPLEGLLAEGPSGKRTGAAALGRVPAPWGQRGMIGAWLTRLTRNARPG